MTTTPYPNYNVRGGVSISEGNAPPGYRYHDSQSGFMVPTSTTRENSQYVEDFCRRKIWLARSHYGALQIIQDGLYEHYDLETKFEVPVNGHKVVYPGPRVVVNTVVDHIIPMIPYFKCEPANPKVRKSRELANLNEKLHNGWMYAANRQALDYRCEAPVRATAKDGVISGELCYEVYDQRFLWGEAPGKNATQEAIDDYEEKQDRFCAAYVGCVDPRFIMFDPATPSKWAVKEYMRSSRDIQNLLIAWEDTGIKINWGVAGISNYDLTIDSAQKWTEYWGEDPNGEHIKVFYVSDQMVAGPMPNPLRFIPFVKAVVGYGRGGPGTPPEKRAWGLIRTAVSLYEAMNRRMSQMDALVDQFAWPRWKAVGNRTQSMNINLGANQLSYMPPGHDLLPMYPPPAILEPLLAEMSHLGEQIEWATVPDTLRGFKSSGREAASMYVTRVQEARLVLESLYTAEHQALQEVGRRVAQIIKRADQPVTLSGLNETKDHFRATIKPADIDPRLALIIELQQEIPAENERRQMLGLQLLGQGAISWDTYQEKYRKEPDPDKVREEIAVDQFMNDPIVKAMLNEQIAYSFDADLYQRMVAARAERAAAMQGQQQQLLGPGGGAGGGGEPGAPTPDGDGYIPVQQLAMQDGIAVNPQNEQPRMRPADQSSGL